MELTEKALNYAEGKANKVMTTAIAEAYAEGYRDGYKDRELEIPIDLRDNKTEYIDLGLPSGTLWAKDYEKIDREEAYFPYCKASNYRIPTETQWKELLEYCKWRGDYSSSRFSFYGVFCIGPNGNSIKFRSHGYMIDEDKKIEDVNYGGGKVFFWIGDDEDGIEKKCIRITGENNGILNESVMKIFSGYKLPVRLVKTK